MSSPDASQRPTIGLLGLKSSAAPGDLSEHHEGFLAQVGRRLASAADIVSGIPPSTGEALAAALAELDRVGVDGIALVLLGAVLPDGCTAALRSAVAPLLIANVQPERTIGEDWSEYDLSFNQGLAAVHALAAECAAADVRFTTLTADWLAASFTSRFEDWARAARTLRAFGGQPPQADLLTSRAALLLDGSAAATLRAMDWNREALLLRPSPGFTATPGPFTLAALAGGGDGELRLCVGSGELLGAAALPQIEQPHLMFAPDAGLEAFMDAWLESGSSPECVIASGDHSERWWRLAELLEIEYEEI